MNKKMSKNGQIEKAPSALDWKKLLQSKEIQSEKIIFR